MNKVIFVMVMVVLGCNTNKGNQNASEEEWISLFNGTDLSNWDIKIRGYELNNNYGSTFYVEDSLLKVQYKPEAYETFDQRFGHIFYKEHYSYYKLAVEYRFTGEQVAGGPGWAYRNSGLMLHGQPANTMGIDQDFPISIEVQLLGGNGEDTRTTCNLCTPGTHVVKDGKLDARHCINSTSKTFHGDQWVKAEIVVLGDSVIHHIMDGDTVLQYTQPQMGGGNVSGHDPVAFIDGKLLSEGSISLQSESHPVHFRKVELLNLKGCLDPKARNYKDYYVEDDPTSCLY